MHSANNAYFCYDPHDGSSIFTDLCYFYLFIFIIDCSDRFPYRKITVLQTMLNATANQLIQTKNIDKLQIKLKLLNFDYVMGV